MILLELAKEIGLETKRASSTNGGEFASSCPGCGGSDRFRIWPSQRAKNCVGTYWCRQCGKRGDAIQFCMDFLGLSFKNAVQKVGAEIKERSHLPQVERSFVAPTLTAPTDKWLHRARDFVLWAHDQIWKFSDKIEQLKKRGISEGAIKAYQIGYCDRDFRIDPIEFGLELRTRENETKSKKLFMPEGLVIPSLEPSGQFVRVKIRRTRWTPEDELPKYWAIRGSMNGLNIVGDVRQPVMAVVESELDAFALHFSCSDRIFAVAVGSNIKNPDNVVDYWAKRRKLLICHDNDSGGLTMNEKWMKLYPHAKSVPVPIEYGKDIGEAVENGLNLDKWSANILN